MVGMSRKERNGRPRIALLAVIKVVYVLVKGEVMVSNIVRATEGGGGHATTPGMYELRDEGR